MASGTGTASSEKVRAAPRYGLFRGSRLGRTIIALQIFGLLVLVGGALVFNETRRALIDAQTEFLRTQGQFTTNLLTELATEGRPDPVLYADLAYFAILAMQIPESYRVRVFDAQGTLIADSFQVNDQIEERPLPNIRRPDGGFRILPGASDAEVSQADLDRAAAELEREAALAMTGVVVAGTRRTDTGERIVSVSLPIQHVSQVLGVLTIEGGYVDAIIARQRAALLPFILIAALVTFASSILLNIFIARPVRKLAWAADQVRLSRARAIDLPEVSRRDDELGELGHSLETMTRALSERMDAIERFAADVAHEIRNPLTSVRSAVETLELVEDEAARERLMNILKQDVSRLDRLITDISNASRLDAELSREAPKAIDIGRLVGDIVALYASSPKKQTAKVEFAPPENSLTVSGREGPLGQVVRNLIDNARSFTALAGRRGAAVRVAVERRRNEAWIIVDDDGPGIPEENLETVFERFYTSRPKEARTASGAGNSGLGLSIARQITSAHDGRLWAENRKSDDGEVLGARFIMALPLRSAS